METQYYKTPCLNINKHEINESSLSIDMELPVIKSEDGTQSTAIDSVIHSGSAIITDKHTKPELNMRTVFNNKDYFQLFIQHVMELRHLIYVYMWL